MTTAHSMRLFIDHCVPESVPKTLEQRGYAVTRLREKTAPDSPDMLVAAVAEANDAVLVTMDGDFKTIAARSGIGHRRFKKLAFFASKDAANLRLPGRLEIAMSLIEHEWEVGNGVRDRRMFVVITADSIRTYR